MTLCLDTHTTPAQAIDGALLCQGHLSQLRWSITEAPGLVLWIREHIPASSAPSEHVKGTRTPPPPCNVNAVDAADLLHARLAIWADTVNAKRPDLARCPQKGTRRTADGEPCGLTDPAATARVSSWLLTHMDWIANQDWAGEITQELTRQTEWLKKRWPTAESAHRLPLPCPSCDRLALDWTPPAAEGWPTIIRCRWCGHIVPEDRHEFYTRLIIDDQNRRAA